MKLLHRAIGRAGLRRRASRSARRSSSATPTRTCRSCRPRGSPRDFIGAFRLGDQRTTALLAAAGLSRREADQADRPAELRPARPARAARAAAHRAQFLPHGRADQPRRHHRPGAARERNPRARGDDRSSSRTTAVSCAPSARGSSRSGASGWWKSRARRRSSARWRRSSGAGVITARFSGCGALRGRIRPLTARHSGLIDVAGDRDQQQPEGEAEDAVANDDGEFVNEAGREGQGTLDGVGGAFDDVVDLWEAELGEPVDDDAAADPDHRRRPHDREGAQHVQAPRRRCRGRRRGRRRCGRAWPSRGRHRRL